MTTSSQINGPSQLSHSWRASKGQQQHSFIGPSWWIDNVVSQTVCATLEQGCSCQEIAKSLHVNIYKSLLRSRQLAADELSYLILSIFNTTYPLRVMWGAGPNSSWHWARGGVHPWQVALPSQGQHTETINHSYSHSQLRKNVRLQINVTLICVWTVWGSQPSCCEVREPTTALPCCPHQETAYQTYCKGY